MDEATTQLHHARALLHDMEPSSFCWPVLAAKVDELERAPLAQSTPAEPETDEDLITYQPNKAPVVWFYMVLVLASSPWVIGGFILLRKWLLLRGTA